MAIVITHPMHQNSSYTTGLHNGTLQWW